MASNLKLVDKKISLKSIRKSFLPLILLVSKNLAPEKVLFQNFHKTFISEFSKICSFLFGYEITDFEFFLIF